MKTEHIAYDKTGFFSDLVTAYLRENPQLAAFYTFPFSIEAFAEAIADRASFPGKTRLVLSKEILRQYGDIDLANTAGDNITSLAADHTFCVVTAHQLNILTGPLYILLKISNTIQVCRQLKAHYPAFHFVPVYMLGSEDHDFEEIATTKVFQKAISWTDKQQGPMGKYNTHGLSSLADEMKLSLGNMPFAEEWVNLLKDGYSRDTLAGATRSIMHSLFGSYGLVCVDGDSSVLKSLFVPVLQRELAEKFSFPLINASSAALEKKGYHAQLKGREINLFYMAGNNRSRIIQQPDGQFEILQSRLSFSPEEIRRELDEHPEYFSPNAVLRPLYQQTILPALAYIGGGGELAYWLQLRSVFEYTGTYFPMLILRTSVLFIGNAQLQKISKLGYTSADLFLDTDELKRKYLQGQEDMDPVFEKIRSELLILLQNMQDQARLADPTLEAWAGAEGRKINDIEAGIEKRIMKAYKAKHEQALQQIEKLKEQLFPEGDLQERIQNGGQWYARYGKEFIDLLIQQDPFRKSFTILTEEVEN